jgi:DNA-binding beta-propeller fold protein YncE
MMFRQNSIKMGRTLILFLVAGLLTGCPGGGDDGGGGTPSSATPTQTIVSGSVQAPNGQIALKPAGGVLKGLANLFSSEVFASISGLIPVPDGTLVQLIRLNPTGTSFSVLSSTRTTGGRYSFNLTDLNLQPSSELAIRVAEGPVQMRAFVTGSNIEIDPASEAAVRLVLDQILANPGSNLGEFTVSELRDIAGGLNQLATVNGIAAGINVESTVTALKDAAAGDAGMAAFMAGAVMPGQTTEGPGDIGNYMPLADGTTWTFQGTHSQNGQGAVTFSNSLIVQGTKSIGAVTATIVVETNSANSHQAEEKYYLKDPRGLLFYGNNDVDDKLTPKLVPYRDFVFPLNPGVTTEVVNKKKVDYGQDLDFDGKNELADVLYEVTVEKFETVSVPKGTFLNVAKVNQKATLTVFSSAGFGAVSAVGTQTIWLAPGIGPIKRQLVVTESGQSVESLTEELVDVLFASHLEPLSLATNDIIYDPNTRKIYASTPGSPGTIVQIDPVTRTVGPSIPVGNEPKKLALSDNGQYLYIGLDGEGAVQRVDLLSQTPGPKFSLGSDATGSLFVEDMEVLPGNPTAVAISRQYKSASPRHAGVAIYDNGVQRPNITPGHTGSNVIEFSQSASTLYGLNNETTEFGFRRMAVDASGVTVADVFTTLPGDLTFWFGVDMKFDGGLVYTTSGGVVDPVARMILGTFTLPTTFGNLVKPDVSVGRVFIQSGTTLRAFDPVTRQQVASLEIPSLSGPGPYSSLIRWGGKGMALRRPNEVFIFESEALFP